MSKDQKDVDLVATLSGKRTNVLEVTLPNNKSSGENGTVINNITYIYLNSIAVTGSGSALHVVILQGRNESLDVDGDTVVAILSEEDSLALEADLLKQQSDLDNF